MMECLEEVGGGGPHRRLPPDICRGGIGGVAKRKTRSTPASRRRHDVSLTLTVHACAGQSDDGV